MEVARGLLGFAEAGATDILVSPIGPESARTLEVAVGTRGGVRRPGRADG